MRTLFSIGITFLSTFCLAQNEEKKNEAFPMSEIRKSFPYNKMASMKLVSFKYDLHETQEKSDTIEIEVPIYEPELPKTNDVVDLEKMFEVKSVDERTLNRILNILMNYDEDVPEEVTFCYEPRNGIVFFDKEGNILGYIEICFECTRIKVEPSTITVSRLWPEEFNALKDIFREVGIRYGTD